MNSTYPLTNDDLLILAMQDQATLAKWYCEFNRWGWPAGFPNPESRELRMAAPFMCRGWAAIQWIMDAIGHRACSREWNSDMTEEEFNDFWRGTYEGVQHARVRYEHLVAERVRAVMKARQQLDGGSSEGASK